MSKKRIIEQVAVMPRFELETIIPKAPLALPYHGPVALLEAPKKEEEVDEDC